MIAILKQGKEFEGFTPGKKYRYIDGYEISTGILYFDIYNNSGKLIRLSERNFKNHFFGGYDEMVDKLNR